MNISTSMRRMLCAAAVMTALLAVTGTQSARAQIGGCRCAAIAVVNNAPCTLTLILQGASERIFTLGANSTGSFACEANLNILVQDCKGRLLPLSVGGCIDAVLADGCCTKVCLEQIARGCYQIVAQPPVVDCPCH